MAARMLQDLRWAARGLRRDPRFTLIAGATLALAIGSVVAIFSLVDGLILRPLPLPRAERLVAPQSLDRLSHQQWDVDYADFEDWQRAGVFASVAVYQCGNHDLAGAAEPVRMTDCAVSEQFFRTLGIAPAIGRAFASEEYRPGQPVPLVLSWSFFTSRFGGDRRALGRPLRFGGAPAYVAGVMAPGAAYPLSVQAWRPLRLKLPDADVERRDNYIFESVARLRPGEGLAQAQAKLAALAGRGERDYPAARRNVTVTAVPLLDYVAGAKLRRILWALFGAVGVVLLIACANITNLLLARGARRQREVAVRLALGASRGGVVRQLLGESILLALGGCIAGLPLAAAGLRGLLAVAPPDTPRLGEVHLDGWAVVFAAVVAVCAALGCGLFPALRAGATRPGAGLAGADPRSTGGPGQRRARNALVVAELATCLALLAGATLALASLRALLRADPGLDTSHLITFSLHLPKSYETPAAVAQFYDQALARLDALPGVSAGAAASALPLGGGGFYLGRAFLAAGQAEPPAGQEVHAGWNVVTPGWFRAAGEGLLAGRDFGREDRADDRPVMIVNQSFARQMFGRASPLGHRVRSWRDENVYREIVGVVRDVRYDGVEDRGHALVYVPHAQCAWSGMTVALRSVLPAGEVVQAARGKIGALDRSLALADVATMEELRNRSLGGSRALSLLLGALAAAALGLAAIGISGVLAYTVAQRTREIGVRMAIGARRADVLALVLGEAGRMIGYGIAFGIALGLAGSRALAPLLYEARPTDAVPYALAAAVLGACGLVAAWLPARRAATVDPAAVLREG
ncbi:MAG TPA: ABC transporter permease [Thermoanaerobaculia bacterium]|nr:ABC transporter permease [Thermoanaerobaculia bacterium]